MEKEKSLTQAQEEEGVEDVFDYIQGIHFEDIKKQFFEGYPEIEDSIQWVINQHNLGNALDLSEISNVDAQRCDIYVVHCTFCNRCWEKPHSQEEREGNTIYYNDFPSYDRDIETCPRCHDLQGRLKKES